MATQSCIWGDMGKRADLNIMINDSAVVDDDAGSDVGSRSHDGPGSYETALADCTERGDRRTRMDDGGQPVVTPETSLLLAGKIVPDGNMDRQIDRTTSIHRPQGNAGQQFSLAGRGVPVGGEDFRMPSRQQCRIGHNTPMTARAKNHQRDGR